MSQTEFGLIETIWTKLSRSGFAATLEIRVMARTDAAFIRCHSGSIQDGLGILRYSQVLVYEYRTL